MSFSRALLYQMMLVFMMLALPAAAPAQSGAAKEPRVVLKGHDPVAYFTERKAVKGDPRISFDWDGERYLFASTANRSKFAAKPDQYAPQFGGYCTGTMSRAAALRQILRHSSLRTESYTCSGPVKFKELAEKDSAWLAGRVVAANEHWRAKP